MTLQHDRSPAAKMVACAELIRRLEHSSIDEVLPQTADVLRGDNPTTAATVYIEIQKDGPREYDVIETSQRHEDDIHPGSFAFGVTIHNGEDLTENAVRAARDRLGGIYRIHGETL